MIAPMDLHLCRVISRNINTWKKISFHRAEIWEGNNVVLFIFWSVWKWRPRFNDHIELMGVAGHVLVKQLRNRLMTMASSIIIFITLWMMWIRWNWGRRGSHINAVQAQYWVAYHTIYGREGSWCYMYSKTTTMIWKGTPLLKISTWRKLSYIVYFGCECRYRTTGSLVGNSKETLPPK